MKTILVCQIVFSLLLNLPSAKAVSPPIQHQHSDGPSIHGMLLFGSSHIYASHLPMFHTPHDYQVLLELELSPGDKAKYLQSLKASSETVYTLVPEVFVLPEMVEHPRPFHAQIFKGHFERGGTLLTSSAVVKISRVLHFRKFVPNSAAPNFSKNILIGNADEQFLIHYITAKPDFDQVLLVKVPPALALEVFEKGALGLFVQTQNNKTPLTAPAALEAVLAMKKVKAPLQVQKILYTEFGDLSF